LTRFDSEPDTTKVATATAAPKHGLRQLLVGAGLCVTASASAGLAPSLVRQLADEDVSTSAMLAVRYPIAAVALWLIVLARRKPRTDPRSLAMACGVGATLYLAQSACYLMAVQRLGGNLAVGVLFVYPTIVVGLTWLFGRQCVGVRDGGAALLGVAGVSLLLEIGSGAGHFSAMGVTLALTAALTYAIYTVLADRLIGRMDIYLFAAIVCSGSALASTSVGVAGSAIMPSTLFGWLCIIALGLFPTLLTTVAFLAGIGRVGARIAVVLSCTEPVFTNVFEGIFFGMRPGLLQLLGTVAIVASAVLAMAGRRASLPDAPMSTPPSTTKT
jgi:drug/metabolite transporter (DMT)-like permease